MAGQIFISYRRSDSVALSGWLHDRLHRELPGTQVFMDVEGIKTGARFQDVLHDELIKSNVLLVVIGPDWLEVQDDSGQRRLDDPKDFVRMELETALAESKHIVPVLVEDAVMPAAQKLPESLRLIPSFQAVDIRTKTFARDADHLIRNLKGLLPAPVVGARKKRGDTAAAAAGLAQPQPHVAHSAMPAGGAKAEGDGPVFDFFAEVFGSFVSWCISAYALTYVWDRLTSVIVTGVVFLIFSGFYYSFSDEDALDQLGRNTTIGALIFTVIAMVGSSHGYIISGLGMGIDIVIFFVAGAILTSLYLKMLSVLNSRGKR